MERLTIKAPSGLIHLKDNKEHTVDLAIKQLSAYEDTRLTPEQIKEIDRLYSEQAKELAELKELRTPKKPTYEGDGYDDEGFIAYDTWYCPNCGEDYEVEYDEYDYCPNCGQCIDWSEEE